MVKDIKLIKTQIEDVYNKICISFGEMDIKSVLDCFSDGDDVVKISNGVVLRGKKQLAEYWHNRLDQVRDLSISIENVEVHIIDENNVWAIADENIRMNGIAQKAVVSNIFTITADGWKILQDHTTYLK